jgi:vacuolar-type H+-ATPase subunit I/STV1
MLAAQRERREREEAAERERQRQADIERERRAEREREAERERRQAVIDNAATAAAAVIRSYYQYVDSGNASEAIALWYDVKNPDNLRQLINSTRGAQVLRIDRISLDQSLQTADVPILVRVMASNGRTECWSGPIAMNKFRGTWKIETMRGLGKTACP